MSEFMVPKAPTDAADLYPTLGPQLVAWMEANLIYGPGDLRGLPARLNADQRRFLYWLYEVFPAHHPQAGKRRVKRAAVMLPKGSAKTEFGGWIVAAELHPDAPVRCGGFDASGQPVGVGVNDPYIPLVAYTMEQSDELAFSALRVVVSEGPLADDFDIGLERITRRDGSGRAEALAGAPDARDGARTTFQLFDESHRMTMPRQLEAHQVMLANTAKRPIADPWSLELTTAFVPGEGSVAEGTWRYAHDIAENKVRDARLFFFHRQASDDHDLETSDGLRDAVTEALGPAVSWLDVDAIIERWQDPQTDKAYFRRVWLNQIHQASGQAFDVERWRELVRPDYTPDKNALVVLGFDGSARADDAALVACEVSTGYVWPLGVWSQGEDWEGVRADVSAAVADAFTTYKVHALFANTDFWSDTIATWSAKYRRGKTERVEIFDAYRSRTKFAHAIRNFTTALATGALSHDGDAVLERHLGNARRADTKLAAEDGQPLWLIRKERSDSPNTIDAAVAAVLAWEARAAAVASGATGRSVYEEHGLRSVGGVRSDVVVGTR